MFSELKRLLKHVSIYGLSNIISRSLTFLLVPFHTNFLLPEQYGFAAIIFSFLAICNVLYSYGLDSAFLRFYLTEGEGYSRKKVFNTAFIPIFATSLVFSLIIFFYPAFFASVSRVGSENTYLLKWAAGILFLDTLAVIPFLVLRAEEKSVPFMVIKVLNVALALSLNYYFIVVAGDGTVGIFKANLAASGLSVLLVAPIIVRKFSFAFSRDVFQSLMRFGLPFIFPGLAIIIMDISDRFIIIELLGASMTGIYNAGYKLAMAIVLLVTAFRFAWHPFFLSIVERADAKEIYARILTYFLLISGGIFLAVSFFINDLISIEIFGRNFIPPEYWQGTAIVPLIMISYIFYGIYVNFIVGVYIKKKSMYLPAVTGVSALINVVLNFILIPHYGIMGAAMATVAAYAFMAFALLSVTRKFYYVHYEYRRILLIVISTILLFTIHKQILNDESIVLEVGALILYPIILFLSGFFNREELNKIKGFLRLS